MPEASCDLVYSSLAFHYIERLDALLAEVHRALVVGGRLVFSVEHPIYTAPSNPGWSVDPTGRKTWPVDGYLNEGARSTDWLTKGVIKQHRTIGTYLGLLLRGGFTISHVEEWGPSRPTDRGATGAGGRAPAPAVLAGVGATLVRAAR